MKSSFNIPLMVNKCLTLERTENQEMEDLEDLFKELNKRAFLGLSNSAQEFIEELGLKDKFHKYVNYNQPNYISCLKLDGKYEK